MNPQAASVLDLFRQGLWPIPNWWPLPDGRCACGKSDCDSPGKHPCLMSWKPYQTHAPTEEDIRMWLAKYPRANWGIVLGEAAGVIVVDLDGAGGEVLLLEAGVELPACASWRSPGGAKVLLKHPGGRLQKKIRLLKGDGCAVDLLADGSQVVVPQSKHKSGGVYEWVLPLREGIAEAPAALLALARQTGSDNGNSHQATAPPIGERVSAGQRNTTLASLAGSMRRRGMSAEAMLAALLIVNRERCDPPLSETEVRAIAASVGRYAPAADPSNPSAPDMLPTLDTPVEVVEHLTDLGNARRLVGRHGQDLRYVHTWSAWITWDQHRWQRDDFGEASRRGKDMVRSIYTEASACPDEAQRKALAQHAMRCESDSRVRALLSMAQSEPEVVARPADFDRDPWLLNVTNGTIDLRTGTLREHRREDLITKLVPVDYAPEATAPMWEAFLERIMAGNADLIAFLYRAVGYSLTGSTREQCWFLLHGKGSNGKSTLLRTLTDLLADFAVWTPAQTLLAKRGEHIENDLARLRGARLVGSIEPEGGRRLAEALVKQLTGGDPVTARFLYSEYFSFFPEFKLWFGTNHKPEIRGTDHAVWRRIRLIPFQVVIPDTEQDRNLPEKLRAEFPGILAWAVRGCLAWQKEGLGMPEAVSQATADYRASMDIIGNFLAECTVAEPGASVGATDLYKAYVAWCKQVQEQAETQRKFGEALGERGFRVERHCTTKRKLRLGLRLVTEQTEQAGPTFR